MPIQFDCPECGNPVRTPDATAGKKGRCPSCSVIMTIPAPANTSAQFSCACGASFVAKPELAGKCVRCPGCGESLKVPGTAVPHDKASAAAGGASKAPTRVTCQCGKSFRAKPELAGKRVACPNCRQPLTIPMASQPADQMRPALMPEDDLFGDLPASSGRDPLGGGTDELFADLPSPHDPLGLATSADPLGIPPGDQLDVGNLAATPGAVAGNVSTQTPKRVSTKNTRALKPFEITTAIFCIVTCLFSLAMLANYLRRMALVKDMLKGLGTEASDLGIGFPWFQAAYTAIGVALGVVAIGILMKQTWPKQFGPPVAYAYFGLLALGIAVSLWQSFRLFNGAPVGGEQITVSGSLIMRMILHQLSIFALQVVGPGMLIALYRDDVQ